MSSLSVIRKTSEYLVPPSEPTPSGTLPLSFMDKLPYIKTLYKSILVYNHGKNPTKVLKQAISRALSWYYPLAGIFVFSEEGELQVDCTGDGVWFVEASADYTLEDVNHLQHPLMLPQTQLLPTTRPGFDPTDTFISIQVTEFTCGGFVIGLRFNHAITDGYGLAQFLTAVSDIARGHTNPILPPVWSRNQIPTPPPTPSPPPPPPPQDHSQLLSLDKLEFSILDIPLEHINHLKTKVMEKMNGQPCSTFDVLVAKFWRSRMRAIPDVNQDKNINLFFVVNIRRFLHETNIIPKGSVYYGNCMFYGKVKDVPAWKIMNGKLSEVVELVKVGKEMVPVEFFKWMKGEVEFDPLHVSPISYDEMLMVVDSSRLGFYEIDFGWGVPFDYIPLPDGPAPPAALFVKAPGGKQAIRLLCNCVVKEHLETFVLEMMKLDVDDDDDV